MESDRRPYPLPDTERKALLGLSDRQVDVDTVTRWMTEHGLGTNFMACLDRAYHKHGLSSRYRKNQLGELHVTLRCRDSRCYNSPGTIPYVCAKLNNAVLAFGGETTHVSVDDRLRELIQSHLKTDPRILECYGDRFRWIFHDINGIPNSFVPSESEEGLGQTRTALSSDYDIRQPVIGLDVGASRTKMVLQKDAKTVVARTRPLKLMEVPHTSVLIDELHSIIEQALMVLTPEARDRVRVGISWAAPVRNGQVTSPVKLNHMTDITDGFHRIRKLSTTLNNRTGLPVVILNDGKAGALAVAKEAGLTDALCLGVGTTLSSGYVRTGGTIDPDIMELTGASLTLDEGLDPRVSRYVSTKFGMTRLAKMMGYPRYSDDFVQLAEALGLDATKHHPIAETIFALLGIYLAEAIAMSYEYLVMRHVVLFGGLTKNAGFDHATRAWLNSRYPTISVTVNRREGDVEYLNARGAALYASTTI